ncbi:uncharacterized protein LOC116416210 [Nasonia vitripennis]|uniref:RNase H type-1 domain-containing protein n=1 Tax=Nasonia vitripennis TaxID=7425 RepID=A0A7M7Q4V1_NASVI|nr:uncharacterized protein LOC116416210 [Nasonia vitripennis]
MWLHRAVLVPRLAYAVLIRWPRAELTGARAALEKLRGQVLRGATGAYRTTPSKALGILVKVESFHLSIIGMAAKAAHRLNAYGQWTQGTRHTRLPGGVDLLPEFSIKTDMMIPRYFFGRRYGVVIPTREEWKARSNSLPGTGDVWYTDGSRAETDTGSGYFCQRDGRGIFFSLGRYATVFQTEIYAILTCAQRNIELGARDRIITICSDSQAALRALRAHRTTSRLVWEYKEVVNNNKVRLLWVPGHTGIRVNEIADRLAALGAKHPPIGLESYTGAARCLLTGEIRDWVEREHTREWQGTQGCRQAKALMGQDTNVGWTNCIAGCSRNNSRLLTQIVTGHNRLRYHSLKIGKEAMGICRRCEGAEETPTHVLTVCPKFAQLRHQCLGELFPTYEEIRALEAGAVLTFWRRAGLPA